MNFQYLPEFLLVIAFIVTAQFVFTPWIPRALYLELIAQNPVWAKSHLDVVKSMIPTKTLKPASYLIGTLLLISIFPGLKSNEPLIYLAYVAMLSILSIALVVVVFDGLRLYRLSSLIPKVDVRQAELAPRKLTLFVPRMIAYIGLTLFAISIVGWIIAVSIDISPTDERLFRGGLISTLVVAPAGFGILQYLIRRRENPANSVPRRIEVRFAFFVLVALSFANLARLAAITSNYPWLVERLSFALGLCFLIAVILWLTLNKKYQIDNRQIG